MHYSCCSGLRRAAVRRGALLPVRVLGGPRTGAGPGFSEELVHDLGACSGNRPQFASVDDLGGAGGGVPDELGDLLDADAYGEAFRMK